ncbi:MAG: signal peptidase I [Planctomycetota bacterium]|jgi:signal peptidase I
MRTAKGSATKRRPPGRARRILRRALRWTERGLAVTGLLFIVYHVCFDVTTMSSGSMSPTLQGDGPRKGDVVLSEKVSYWFRPPRRWEVVAFFDDEGTSVMKRVVGLPGEKIKLCANYFFVDGRVVPRPGRLARIDYIAAGRLVKGREANCRGGYFVLGDHSLDSMDSRFVPPVRPADITGRAWLRIWPLSRFGRVNS